MVCSEQALQASDELKESLDLEHKEVSQVVSAFLCSGVRMSFSYMTPIQIAALAK